MVRLQGVVFLVYEALQPPQTARAPAIVARARGAGWRGRRARQRRQHKAGNGVWQAARVEGAPCAAAPGHRAARSRHRRRQAGADRDASGGEKEYCTKRTPAGRSVQARRQRSQFRQAPGGHILLCACLAEGSGGRTSSLSHPPPLQVLPHIVISHVPCIYRWLDRNGCPRWPRVCG